MRAGSLDRTDFLQTAIATALTFAALVLLAIVLAYWTWAWLAPRTEPRLQPAPAAAAPAQGAEGLFGRAHSDRSAGAPAGIAIRLLGVASATGSQSGYAVLRLNGSQTVVIREGGEVEPGIRLTQVRSDHVLLERAGVQQTLAWPEKGSAAAAAAPPVAR
jgi:general secretion pathway protein C